MVNQTFNEVWAEIGSFIRKNRVVLGSPEIHIYSDYVDIVFKTYDTIRVWPEGGESRRIYAEDGRLILGYSWSYESEDHD